MLFMANKVLGILALGLAVVCRIPASSADNFSVLQLGSQNIHLPLNGSKWTLQCADSNSNGVSWLINSVTQSFSPLMSYFMTSFDHTSGISSDVVFDPVYHLNQTNLTCLTYVNHSVTAIYTAILIIEDVPLPPRPRVTVTDGSVAYISWDPPYTGSIYQVTGYNIILQLTNGVSTTQPFSKSTLSFNYTLNYSQTDCVYMSVSLVARNMVGTSSPGNITKLLPAVPGEFQLATQITYTLNNEPHIRASFTFLELCKDSNATYFLILYNEHAQKIFTSEEKTSSHSGTMTYIDIQNNEVKSDAKYQIVVFVRTEAGTRNASQSIDTHPISTEPNSAGLSNRIGGSYYIMGGAVAGFFILLILIIIVVSGIVFWKRRSKSRKKVCSETALTRMVPNTVYDTQISTIYDEIHPTSNSYLQINLTDEGYTSVSITPEQVRAIPHLQTNNQTDGEEEYTEMKPIGTVLPRRSLLSESNSTMAHQAEESKSTSFSANSRPENPYHFE